MFEDYYERKVEQVIRSTHEFKMIYGEHLAGLSGNYFGYRDSLKPNDRDLLKKLEEVGSGIAELTNLRVGMKDPFPLSYDYQDAMRKFEMELFRIEDAFLEKSSENLRIAHYGRWTEAKELEEIGKKLHDAYLQELQNQLEAYQKSYCVEYFENVGKAYKQSLIDVGVDFSVGVGDLMRPVFTGVGTNNRELPNYLDESLRFYPRHWVSNIDCKLILIDSDDDHVDYSRRCRQTGLLTVDIYSDSLETMFHEIGHVVELFNRDIGRVERLALLREMGSSSFRKPQKSSSSLKTVTDSLLKKYSGSIHTAHVGDNDSKLGNVYEMFTTGVAALFTGVDGGLRYDYKCTSPTHRDLMLGFLAVV